MRLEPWECAAGSGLALDHPHYPQGGCVARPHRELSPRPPPPVSSRALASASPTRGLAPLRKQAEATLPATAAVPSPARGVGHRTPGLPPLLPRVLVAVACPVPPRRGLLKRSQGSQVTPAGCPQWPPCTCGPLSTGPGWAATCWGPSGPSADASLRLCWGFSTGSFPVSVCLSYNAGLPGWVSPLGGASPESQPQEALGASCSYAVPQAAEVRQGRPGAGGLAGTSLGLPPLLLVPGPPLSGFCPVARR